jgi:hypothetical protein
MILSSGDIFKSFAEQRCFSFDCDLSIKTSTGISKILASGETSSVSLFSFKSGRIFDCFNRFVKSYSPSESINISGNFCSGIFGYYIDQYPVCLNSNVSTSTSSFENLVFSTSGSEIEFFVDIFGEVKPKYELVFPSQSQVTGSPITGFLKNTSSNAFQSFKLFSGSSYFPGADYNISSTVQGLKIKPNNSGQIVLSFSGGTSFSLDSNKQALPIYGNLYLDTNFGSIDIPVSIPLKSSPFYYIDFQEDSNIQYGETGKFWSFELERQACSGTRFEFILDDVRWLDPYNSFSDKFFIKTGYNNGAFLSSSVPYNIARGIYAATGYISGAGCSGDDTFNVRFEILHSHPSGIYANKFKYSISGIEEKFLFSGFLEEGL